MFCYYLALIHPIALSKKYFHFNQPTQSIINTQLPSLLLVPTYYDKRILNRIKKLQYKYT